MPDEDTFEKTFVTLVLAVVFAATVLGPMFAGVEPPPWELQISITGAFFLVLGRMWGIETDRLLNGITISTDGGRPRDDDRDDQEDR
ncbi:hypothetical protein GCM10009646_78720 [Streptomyces aureus]